MRTETLMDWRTDSDYIKAAAKRREVEADAKAAEIDLQTAEKAITELQADLDGALRSGTSAALAQARSAITEAQDKARAIRDRIGDLCAKGDAARAEAEAAEKRARAEAQRNLTREYKAAAKELLAGLETAAAADAKLRELRALAVSSFVPPSERHLMYAGLPMLALDCFRPYPGVGLFGNEYTRIKTLAEGFLK